MQPAATSTAAAQPRRHRTCHRTRATLTSPIDRQANTCLSSTGVDRDPELFRALADPTRRLILDELVDRRRQTLFELCARLATKHGIGSSRQAISQHLDVLEAAGLVRSVREGRYRFFELDPRPLRAIARRWPIEEE